MLYEEFYIVNLDNILFLGINIFRFYEVKVMVLFVDMILIDLVKNVYIINFVYYIMIF